MDEISDELLSHMIFGGPQATREDVQSLKTQAELLLAEIPPVVSRQLVYESESGAITFRTVTETSDDEPFNGVSIIIFDGENEDEPYLHLTYNDTNELVATPVVSGRLSTEENGFFGQIVVEEIIARFSEQASEQEINVFKLLRRFCRALQGHDETKPDTTPGKKVHVAEAVRDIVQASTEHDELVREASAPLTENTLLHLSGCVYEPPLEDKYLLDASLPRLQIHLTDREKGVVWFALFMQDESIHTGKTTLDDGLHDLFDVTEEDGVDTAEAEAFKQAHSQEVIEALSASLVDFALRENGLL